MKQLFLYELKTLYYKERTLFLQVLRIYKVDVHKNFRGRFNKPGHILVIGYIFSYDRRKPFVGYFKKSMSSYPL